MNFLMLRGQVPQDRDPQEIVFDKIEDVDDMWTQLFFAMLKDSDYGEVWYWGGNRKKRFAYNFIERWIPSFVEFGLKYHNYKNLPFIPDVIFCRGGFREYHYILERFPNAFKIYHGATRRFLPQPGFYGYNLVLHDFPEGEKIGRKKFPNMIHSWFIKPAADNIFYPMPEVKMEYDVCFPAQGSQAHWKGHKFVYSTAPADLKILNLGSPSKFKIPKNITSYRVLRTEMSKNIAKCKMGIIIVHGIKGLPRTLPELLSCGKPIVVLDEACFWKDKYMINGVTGELANRENFWDVVKHVLNNVDKYDPRKYYEENLSLDHAARFLRGKIDEISIQRSE